MLGLAVLALIVIRLMARLASRQPPITPEPPVWQALLASTTHFALYAFMVAMPDAGWVLLSASGKTIPFFGLELQIGRAHVCTPVTNAQHVLHLVTRTNKNNIINRLK